MINNDTKPPKNNYTEKKRERGLFKVTTGRLAKCMFFRLPASRQQMKMIHIWANCCSNGAHQARARVLAARSTHCGTILNDSTENVNK